MPAPVAALPRLVRPLQEFISTETLGGVLLLVAAVGALVWANLPFGHTYGDFWGAHLAIDLNAVRIDEPLRLWVNDGLMAVFFFVVGLEIKREVLRGELAGPRKAALPVAAALGGMLLPATLYLALNAGGAGERGWGIPMATDIAFAVGVLALLGSRVPSPLRVFLLALAIVDDLGAILVIAVFYSNGIAFGWLGAAAGIFALVALLGRIGVRDVVVYVALGIVAWLAVYESGVHATIAGVALALLTPVTPFFERDAFREPATELVEQFTEGRASGTPDGADQSRAALRDLEELSRETQSVLDRLEHALHPWTGYAIVPLFALANAGIELDGGVLRDALSSRVTAGVALGLMLGKPAGILLFAWLAVRLRLAALPAGVRWAQVAAAGMIAGIGFTVSLFIGGLAFKDGALVDQAKIGIFGGSLLIGLAGLLVLRRLSPETASQARSPSR
jgi:NhaA family Na+:H+ antiporter